MKRVRCPKCDHYIIFDETKYTEGQSLVFQCEECGKQFGIRIGVAKLKATQKEDNPDEQANEGGCGSIVVIENVFHFKQVIPLQMGDNVIGRYQKGNPINTAFETVDPSVDLNHCTINVSRNKRGELCYTLADNKLTFKDPAASLPTALSLPLVLRVLFCVAPKVPTAASAIHPYITPIPLFP